MRYTTSKYMFQSYRFVHIMVTSKNRMNGSCSMSPLGVQYFSTQIPYLCILNYYHYIHCVK